MIIEFNGELSQESKRYILKQQHKIGVICYFITFILFSAFILFFGYTTGTITYLLPFEILFLIWIIIMIMFPKLNISQKIMKEYYPRQVIITKEEISFENISYESYCCKKLIDVKKVIDCGNFYYFKFYFPFNHNCVCQKDLITKGTLEEFEKLFEDKIVRKTKTRRIY